MLKVAHFSGAMVTVKLSLKELMVSHDKYRPTKKNSNNVNFICSLVKVKPHNNSVSSINHKESFIKESVVYSTGICGLTNISISRKMCSRFS